MRLLLVRHGETAWNAEHRLQGDTDVALSHAGRTQVAALAPTVAAHAPTHVVCSPLTRTRETASLLGLAVDRIDERWREADLGEWNGRHVHDLPPEHYAAWRAGAQAPPGGEALDVLATRVLDGLAALPAHDVVVVVTHGGPIRAVLRHLVGLGSDRTVPVGPATLTVLERYDDGTARLSGYNQGPPPERRRGAGATERRRDTG